MDERVHHNHLTVNRGSQPALSRHMKLHRDSVRERWVILAPERILTPNQEAADVLLLCDGARTVAEIAATLAHQYDAEPDAIAADIIPLLQGLADSGVIRP